MNSINNINDEKVRNLAKTLRDSGLALSESEAVRMAKDMTQTESAISQKATTKTQESRASSRRVVKEDSDDAKKTEEAEEIPRTYERHDQGLVRENHADPGLKKSEEIPKKEDEPDLSKVSLYEAAGLNEKPDEEFEEPVSYSESEKEEEPEKEEEADKEEYSEEKPKFVTPERKPKKDRSEYEESQVDLSNVFNYSGKN